MHVVRSRYGNRQLIESDSDEATACNSFIQEREIFAWYCTPKAFLPAYTPQQTAKTPLSICILLAVFSHQRTLQNKDMVLSPCAASFHNVRQPVAGY
jgi:hypothetical protein